MSGLSSMKSASLNCQALSHLLTFERHFMITADDLLHQIMLNPHSHNIINRLAFVDICFQNFIQQRIRRQTILIFLVEAEFGRRRPHQNLRRQNALLLVAPLGQTV